MNQVLCSTGTFLGRPNNRNYKLFREIAEHIDCDGFEFMMYSTWYEIEKELTAELKRTGRFFPTFHCEKRIGEKISSREPGDWEEAFSKFEINCRIAAEIGSEVMVLHLWNGPISDSHMENNIEAFGRLNEAAKKYGIVLTVENVVCNQGSPMEHLRELCHAYQEVQFTFDTKMAAFHKELSWLYEPEWKWLFEENHIRHLHVNDYCGGYMDWEHLRTLHIGDGTIDFTKFFEYIKKQGYHGYLTVEASSLQSDGVVRYDKLNESLERVRRLSS